jgi:hypothetical protein
MEYYQFDFLELVTEFDRRLMALDLQSTVILGDPTVTRPGAARAGPL